MPANSCSRPCEAECMEMRGPGTNHVMESPKESHKREDQNNEGPYRVRKGRWEYTGDQKRAGRPKETGVTRKWLLAIGIGM